MNNKLFLDLTSNVLEMTDQQVLDSLYMFLAMRNHVSYMGRSYTVSEFLAIVAPGVARAMLVGFMMRAYGEHSFYLDHLAW